MTTQDKAYCGDALAQLAIGELLPRADQWHNVGGIFLSNKTMTKAYHLAKNIPYEHAKSTDGYYAAYGTKYEEMVYDLFLDKGYDEVKKFIKRTLIPAGRPIKIQ